MADFERILAAMGAVPSGTRPKTILAGDENQEPGYYATDPLSNIVRVLKKRQLDIEATQKKQQEAAQKKADMYKTLRDAGYEPKKAYEAVAKNQFPEPGKEDFSLKKSPRDIILDKMSKGQVLTEGEQKVYDETIQHKEEDVANPTQVKMRDQILGKISRGEALTKGEQKIYDETIKKGAAKSGGQDNLDAILSNKNTTSAPDASVSDLSMRGKDMVPVISPDGTPGWIPIKKLAAALKAGYTTRKK